MFSKLLLSFFLLHVIKHFLYLVTNNPSHVVVSQKFRIEPMNEALGVWVLDMVVLYNVHMVAMSTSYFDVRFYDIASPDFKA